MYKMRFLVALPNSTLHEDLQYLSRLSSMLSHELMIYSKSVHDCQVTVDINDPRCGIKLLETISQKENRGHYMKI